MKKASHFIAITLTVLTLAGCGQYKENNNFTEKYFNAIGFELDEAKITDIYTNDFGDGYVINETKVSSRQCNVENVENQRVSYVFPFSMTKHWYRKILEIKNNSSFSQNNFDFIINCTRGLILEYKSIKTQELETEEIKKKSEKWLEK